MAFVDIKKAFDTVDHGILMEKLSHYGISSTELKWFCSYLINRRECCEVPGILSNIEYYNVRCPSGAMSWASTDCSFHK